MSNTVERRKARQPRRRLSIDVDGRDLCMMEQGAFKERERVKAWLVAQRTQGRATEDVLDELFMAVLS